MMQNMAKSGTRFAQLDGLRGLAAFLVLLHHVELYGGHGTHLLTHAYLAVDIFFILSGFVIALAYEVKLRAGMTLPAFAEVRLVRLYPVMGLAVLFSGLLSWAGISGLYWSAPWLLIELAFLPTPIMGRIAYPYNGAQWSLAAELLVNLAYAAVVSRFGNRRLALLVLALGAAEFWVAYRAGSLSVGWSTSNLVAGLIRASFGFFCGVGIGRGWHAGIRTRRSTHVFLPLLALIGIVVAISASSEAAWYEDPVAAVLLFPLLVWLVACGEIPERFKPSALYLGAISYPLYAFQQPVGMAAGSLAGTVQPWWVMAISSLLSLTVAVLVASYLDEPMRTGFSRLLHLRRISMPLGSSPAS